MDETNFLAQVTCMTYNHANYITDTMNGFVMQQTSFPFVCIIIDDASTDGEPDVIKSYLDDNFDKREIGLATEDETDEYLRIYAQHKENKNCYFCVLLLKYNHYSINKPKTRNLAEFANSIKYTALCEGDDYWTDPLKLQKQVDILEADETLMAVVTNSKEVDKEGTVLKAKQENVVPDNKAGRYDLRSFINKVHHYPTATVCYRRTHTEEISKMTKHTANPYLGDWTFWICLHIFGDFYYLDEVTSAYRINPTSLTHTCDRVGRAKAHWTICKAVQDILPDEYADIRKSLDDTSWMWVELAFAYRHEHQYVRMFWCFFVAFVKNPKGLMGRFKK